MHPITLSPAHRYADPAGAEYLGVTSMLKAAGLMGDTPFYTDEARDRGSYIHQAIAYDIVGDLVEPADDDPIRPYVVAFRQWLEDTRAETIYAERPMADPTLRLAGTVDWIGQIRGAVYVVDHKSGTEAPWHALQTACYAHLAFVNELGARFKRAALYLRDDGTYRFVEHPDRNDWKIAAAALAVARWRSIHGC
jgi:hypothetical protein